MLISGRKEDTSHQRKGKFIQAKHIKSNSAETLALSVLVVVSTRETYFVEELVAGALDARVRIRVIIGVVGGDEVRRSL